MSNGVAVWQTNNFNQNNNLHAENLKQGAQLLEKVETATKQQNDCCETHTNQLSQIEDQINQSKPSSNELFGKLTGPAFFFGLFQLTGTSLIGLTFAVGVGLSFSFIYLLADYYCVIGHKYVQNRRIQVCFYFFCSFVKMYTSFAIFGAIFMAMGHSHLTGQNVTFENIFRSLSQKHLLENKKNNIVLTNAIFNFVGYVNLPLKEYVLY